MQLSVINIHLTPLPTAAAHPHKYSICQQDIRKEKGKMEIFLCSRVSSGKYQ